MTFTSQDPVSLTPLEAMKVASRAFLPEPQRAWTETRTDYPRDRSVASLFEETVSLYPDAVAVVFGCQQLTYRELNVRANRLAHRLRQMGVGPETMVGCCFERSLELIVALVAILKAGGAYVPLDASYPKERFEFLLKDIRTPVMLTQRSIANAALAERDLPLLFVEDDLASTRVDDADPSPLGGPQTLAYVMYTSGSTGQPKGVMIENRAIVRLVRNTNFCHFGPDEVFLQFAPISFDALTLEIWGPLLNGGRLVIMPPRATSLDTLGRVIRESSVTTVWLTAGLFHLMVEQHLEDLRPVRQLVAGGDVLSAPHVRKVLENLTGCRLINGYGPTENTTFTCCYAMRSGETVPNSIPIGRPISNTEVYILDELLQPVPPGVAGELFAAGDGLARGYLHRPEATAEKFLLNPYAAGAGGRMYRTGDRARWREDGTIEFLGRIDTQVKILGYRIEPGEIEAALGQYAGLKQVCVVPYSDPANKESKRLVAYYVPAKNVEASAKELREFLAGKLPQYMVPSLFVPLDALPLSPNGKVDRAALPDPVAVSVKGAGNAHESTTRLEQVLLDLWRKVLRVDQPGLDENFFDLGGDSLLLVSVHSNLQKVLEIEIPVTDLFEFTTIRTLALHLGENKSLRPSFSEVQDQARKQREAFARARQRR